MSAAPIRVFDGHNDVLMHVAAAGGVERFLHGEPAWAIDLPGLEASPLAGGLFALWPGGEGDMTRRERADGGWAIQPQPALDPQRAHARVRAMIDAARALAAAAPDRLAIVSDGEQLTRELAGPRRVMVLHVEGAEAVLDAPDGLEQLTRLGVRSIGLVWSRPNRYGHGVPFGFPASPDSGPGLTPAGRALVARCGELGVLVDLAHLNARGFWDVASLSSAPLVVSHANAHAICPSARNLLDEQLDAIGDSGGLVGVNFNCADVRADGRAEAATPLDAIVDHVEYVAARIGVTHVGFGSDLCGALMPADLARVERYGALLDCMARRGFSDAALRAIAGGNWLRVLREAWRPRPAQAGDAA